MDVERNLLYSRAVTNQGVRIVSTRSARQQRHVKGKRSRDMLTLGKVALAVLIVNLPFGYWRVGLRRFSVPWFLAVHAPVPLVIGIRVLAGLG